MTTHLSSIAVLCISYGTQSLSVTFFQRYTYLCFSYILIRTYWLMLEHSDKNCYQSRDVIYPVLKGGSFVKRWGVITYNNCKNNMWFYEILHSGNTPLISAPDFVYILVVLRCIFRSLNTILVKMNNFLINIFPNLLFQCIQWKFGIMH